MAWYWTDANPDSKVHGANMGPIWGWQDSGGSHVGPMNLAIWEAIEQASENDNHHWHIMLLQGLIFTNPCISFAWQNSRLYFDWSHPMQWYLKTWIRRNVFIKCFYLLQALLQLAMLIFSTHAAVLIILVWLDIKFVLLKY